MRRIGILKQRRASREAAMIGAEEKQLSGELDERHRFQEIRNSIIYQNIEKQLSQKLNNSQIEHLSPIEPSLQ